MMKIDSHMIKFRNSLVQIVPSYGCNITSLTLDRQSILDANTDPEKLASDYLCKSDFLAPFPNRVSDGKYTFQGKTYQLVTNEQERGHALHGFITQKKFSMTLESSDSDESVAVFQTEIKPDEFQGYPFYLQISTSFQLTTTRLTITMTGKNIGNTEAPYGVGWHPYLTVGKSINDCMLQIQARSVLETSKIKELIPTGKKLSNPFGTNKKLIGNAKFDTCFTDLESNTVIFENIELFMDNTMKYVQMYTPDDRQSIAIEPMSCAPDAFNNDMGRIALKPQQSVSHTFGLRII